MYPYSDAPIIFNEKWRLIMKSSIRDKMEGTLHEVKGKVKEVAGKITDNPELEAEGADEKIAGKVQEKVGQVKNVLRKKKENKHAGIWIALFRVGKRQEAHR
jgi:uncharacterized protein YjbJ (UPF0337 family)